MKKLLLVLSFISVFVLNGCLIEAFYVCSTLLTAKSAYNGYETITSLKSIKEGPPIFREYQVAYISIDVQPRKENSESVNHIMENVYCRTANAMSRESGSKLTFRPYDGEQVAACADALIIQVKENKPSMIGKIMSGDKIHASVKYIDKKSVRSVCEERYDIARDYQEMIGLMSMSAMLKMSKPTDVDQNSWIAVIKKLQDHQKKYPIVTAEEKEILSKG
jgi:hypothetical protein